MHPEKEKHLLSDRNYRRQPACSRTGTANGLIVNRKIPESRILTGSLTGIEYLDAFGSKAILLHAPLRLHSGRKSDDLLSDQSTLGNESDSTV